LKREGIYTVLPVIVISAKIQKPELELPESDRPSLAAGLLDSLPGVPVEKDESHTEAVRRAEEWNHDLYACLAHDKFFELAGRPVRR
jgi:hypothetical protein